MKIKYTSPCLEITRFSNNDIITLSSVNTQLNNDIDEYTAEELGLN